MSKAIWANGTLGWAVNVAPVSIQLKENVTLPRKKTIPTKEGGFGKDIPVLQKFLKSGLIRPCRSPYNIPILPVMKPNSEEYHFVQDPQTINEITQDIYPTVPNPYTLVTDVTGDSNHVFCVGF